MSYEKAADLLDLAFEIAARHRGMSFAEIDAISTAPTPDARRRNTQRLVKVLERVFGERISTSMDEADGKRVTLKGDKLRELAVLKPEEMTALDRAIDALDAANSSFDAVHLKELRTKLRLLTPQKGRRALEVDYEALLGSGHMIARHGPRSSIDPAIMEPLTEAILALKQVTFDYPKDNGLVRRVVNPFGIITGYRTYLVAMSVNSSGSNPSRWRIDRLKNLEVLDTPSVKPDDFDISAFAKRGFGAFNIDTEYGEVEWRFDAKIADNVLSFQFHPDQQVTREQDGSVTVRFKASGYLEMAWALYPWGNKVTVVKPEPLRELVAGHQRSDFASVP